MPGSLHCSGFAKLLQVRREEFQNPQALPNPVYSWPRKKGAARYTNPKRKRG